MCTYLVTKTKIPAPAATLDCLSTEPMTAPSTLVFNCGEMRRRSLRSHASHRQIGNRQNCDWMGQNFGMVPDALTTIQVVRRCHLGCRWFFECLHISMWELLRLATGRVQAYCVFWATSASQRNPASIQSIQHVVNGSRPGHMCFSHVGHGGVHKLPHH